VPLHRIHADVSGHQGGGGRGKEGNGGGEMRKILTTVLLMGSTCFAAGPSIRVTVIRQREPLSGAMVVVQRFSDKSCAKLFNSKSASPETAEKLKSCSTDLSPGYSDQRGEIQFNELKPGWYAVRVLFLYDPAPAAYRTACEYGDMALMLSSDRDTTGKYNAMAQQYPFELKSADARSVEFRFDKSIGTNGKCLTSR
jgi:hypothetical protein